MTRYSAGAMVSAAICLAAITSAGPASAAETLLTEKVIELENCGVVGSGQFCPSDAPSWATGTLAQFTAPAGTGAVKVEFTANKNHCSDVIAHLFVDGREWGSHIVHPGQTDGGYEIPVSYGLHQVGVQAEGLSGGCNTGSLASWGGTLRVYQIT